MVDPARRFACCVLPPGQSGPRLGLLALVLATFGAVHWLREARPSSGPYVTAVTGDAATICRVDRGRILSKRLTGLRPGTVVHARAPGGKGGEVVFRTARPPGEGFTFCVVGDTGLSTNRPGRDTLDVQHALAAALARAAPDFVVHLGDLAYYDGDQDQIVAQFFEPFADPLARCAWFFTPGNHDVRDGAGSAYFALFPSDGPDPRFYSFDWGDVHFVSLDASDNTLPDDHPQYAWLERDLAAVPPGRARVVLQHTPIYSTGCKGPNVQTLGRPLLPLLKRHGVALLLAGHDHSYERTQPIDGTAYVVSGGGGARLYPRFPAADWTAASAIRHHFLKLTVATGGASLELEAIDVGRTVFDRATITLHPTP